METATGKITSVQEQRFRHQDGDGVSRLFLLSHHASSEAGDLRRFAQSGARVRVEFETVEELLGHVAHEVKEIE